MIDTDLEVPKSICINPNPSPELEALGLFKNILGKSAQGVQAQVALHIPWAEKTSVSKRAFVPSLLEKHV